jgi:hypothetical protein
MQGMQVSHEDISIYYIIIQEIHGNWIILALFNILDKQINCIYIDSDKKIYKHWIIVYRIRYKELCRQNLMIL